MGGFFATTKERKGLFGFFFFLLYLPGAPMCHSVMFIGFFDEVLTKLGAALVDSHGVTNDSGRT